jgi:hypothetical protein
MKKIGIAFDDYKKDKFIEALKAEKLLIAGPYKLPSKTSMVQVLCTESEFEETVKKVNAICQKLQIGFNRSN